MKITISLTHLLWIIVAYTAMAVTLRAQPYIFNATESAAPGDAIYLQGDNLPTPTTGVPSVYFHVVTGSESIVSVAPYTPLPANTTLLSSSSILSFTKQAIQARLPKNAPLGLYVLWVYDGTSYSAPVFINRARAVSFDVGEIYAGFTTPAWTNAAINYTNPGGYTFRVFGRNLNLPGATPTVSLQAGSTVVAATVVANAADPNDPNILQVKVPTTSALVAGTAYTVNVSNGYGHGSGNYDITPSMQTIKGMAVGTDIFGLGVPWDADFSHVAAKTINVATDTSLNAHVTYASMVYTDSNGNPDWVNAIQQALYDAGNYKDASNNPGATVYLPGTTNGGIGNYQVNQSGEAATFAGPTGTITQPAGTELLFPNYVVLKGDGTTGTNTTTITDTTIGLASPNRAMSGATTSNLNIGLLNLIYQQTATPTATDGPPQIVLEGSEMFFNNLNLQLGHTLTPTQGGSGPAIGGSFLIGDGASHDVLVQNIDLNYGEFDAETGAGGTENYVIVRDNTFEHHGSHKRTRMLIGGIQNVLFEGNLCSRDSAWPGNHDADGAYEQGQVENDGGSYQTIIYNTLSSVNNDYLTNFHSNDGETIGSQGQPPGGYQTGSVSSATTTSITDSAKAWPASVLIGQLVTITAGPGTGQYQTVTANTGTTITVGTAWTTTPTSASKYSVTTDGYDIGTVSTASGTAMSGTSSSGYGTYWPTGSKNLTGCVVAIINGPGAGQWRRITGNTVNTLTVDSPWTENPTGASTYSISNDECDHALIKGNLLSDQPRGISLYTGSHDCAVVNNTFVDTGETIYLRSDERLGSAQTWPTGGWYGRTNLTWCDVVADNIAFDTDGSWVTTISAQLDQNTDSSLVGSIILGTEFRRNVIVSNSASVLDHQIDLAEGYDNWAHDTSKPFVENHIAGHLASIFDENESVNTNSSNTNYPLYLNTSSYQTSILNDLNLGTLSLTPQPYSDATITGATHASVGTSYTTDPGVLMANFNGSGGSTGGTSDLVDSGAKGVLSGAASVILGGTAFGGSNANYMECTVAPGAGGTGHVQLTPTTSRTSWGRIFDFRTNQNVTDVAPVWLVNGGFEFFWYPHQTPITGNMMRPLDISNGTNGLRLTFYNTGYTANGLQMQFITGTGGGGVNLPGTFSPGFVMNTAYHIGVTFSTDPASKTTTAKLFCIAGTGSINTSSNTVGTGGLIGMTTFTLSATAVNNVSGYLSGGAWNFGDSFTNGGSSSVVNDYDGLNLYSQDPGTFPALP